MLSTLEPLTYTAWNCDMADNRIKRLPYNFHDKIIIDSDCWRWTAFKSYDGYGRASVNGKQGNVHRFSYEVFKGEIPKDLEIDHLCKNRDCLNPDHLEAISHQENVKRGSIAQKTHCPKGHPYSGDNLIIENKKNGLKARRCRACRRPEEALRVKMKRRGLQPSKDRKTNVCLLCLEDITHRPFNALYCNQVHKNSYLLKKKKTVR